MNVKIDFRNLVRQLLPGHKRQPVRLALLRALTEPLAELFGRFDAWRGDIRREIGMTGQVGILEGFLRHKYRSERIRIITHDERGLSFGLRAEGVGSGRFIGLDVSDTDLTGQKPQPAPVPLRGETTALFGDVDFIVQLPPQTDAEAVGIDVERFKLVLVTYKILVQ